MRNIKEIREALGYTQKEFCERFGIPKRTVENWEEGKRNPPEYVISLIEELIKKGEIKMAKYAVIGGQYEPYCYGETDSLHAAKLLATKCKEYWDNWQGWHTPKIYAIEDTKRIETEGWITYQDGQTIRVPNGNPSWCYNNDSKKWEEFGR